MSTTAAYAIGYLTDVRFGDEIATYLERIDATLEPHGGHFLVHGGTLSPQEGTWDGDIIIIAFPNRESALAWYASPAYQAILPLRTDNSTGIVTIVDGAAPGHRGVDKLRELLADPA